MDFPRFIYILNDLATQEGQIRKNEVGIIESETADKYLVNFVVNNRKIELNKNLLAEFNPLETGDQFDKKICNVCHRLLDTTVFSRNQNGKNNRIIRRPSCEDCRKIIDGVKMKQSEARRWNKTKPHLTVFECPICHKTTIAGLSSKVVLDHDHDTGSGRGWICDSCNTGIGRFKDDIKLLFAAIKYLRPDFELPDH